MQGRIKHCFWPTRPDGSLRPPEEREPPTPDKPLDFKSGNARNALAQGKGKGRADGPVYRDDMSSESRSRGSSGDSSTSGSSGAGTASTGVTTPGLGYPEVDQGPDARGLSDADVKPGRAPDEIVVGGDAVLSLGGQLADRVGRAQ